MKPVYYECGICGAMHSASWNGDCREDEARFMPEDLDKKHGDTGWIEIEMTDVDRFQAGGMEFYDPE